MSRFFKLFTLICIYIFIFSAVSYAGFEDISGHWCEKEINDFYESKFVEGYGDGTFRPDAEITRAELCKIVNSYMNFEASGEWQEANISVAKKEGYLTIGSANEEITREEAFVVLSRIMKLDDVEFELPYEDSGDISIWAVPAIKSLTLMEYINGYETNEIRPKQNITRAEVVKVLHDFVGIGGLDEKFDGEEFSIGYLSHNKYGLEFIKIEDELEIQSGDSIVLAATVSEDEDVNFEIVSGEEFAEFDKESLRFEGIKTGDVKISAETSKSKEIIKIIIK